MSIVNWHWEAPMRGILAAMCILSVGLAMRGTAFGDDLKFRPPDRARVRFSNQGAESESQDSDDDQDENAEEPEETEAPRRRSRSSDVEPAGYVERRRERDDEHASDRVTGRERNREEGESNDDQDAEERRDERDRRGADRQVQPAVAYMRDESGRVIAVQAMEPISGAVPGTVTLGAPVFDPYDASLRSSSYPAAAPVAGPVYAAPPPGAPVYGAPPAYAGPPPSGPSSWFGGFGSRPNDMMGPYWRHRTGIYGDFLYLRPRNAEVPYAVPIDGPVAPVIGNGIQNGQTATINPGWQIAFDVGFTVALCETASVGAKWTHFDQTTDSSASTTPPDVLRALVTHPLGTNAATDTLDANASLRLKYDLIDADYSGLLVGDEGYVVNYFGGGRYIQFDQNFNSNFTAIGSTNVNSAITFNGGGPQIGLMGERRSCKTGCLVYARGMSTFVVGQFKATYNETDATGVPIVNSGITVSRIVPMLDLEIGAGWTSPAGRVRLTAGYLISSWFNMVTTSDWISAVQSNQYNGLSNTITFDGLMARAAVQF